MRFNFVDEKSVGKSSPGYHNMNMSELEREAYRTNNTLALAIIARQDKDAVDRYGKTFPHPPENSR